jgi:surface polysaccharide O-acyltransferase-like enzyme
VLSEDQTLNQTKRYFWIDAVRALAILSIVYTHTSEEVFIYLPDGNTGLLDLGFQAVSRLIGRVGVPMFLMLSGYMGIRKSFVSVEEIRTFYTRKILPLLKNNFFWVFLMGVYFFVYFRFANDAALPILDYSLAVMKQAVFLGQQYGDGYYFRQIWFVGVIISMWLITPGLSYIANANGFKLFKTPFLILTAITIVGATITDLSSSLHGELLQKLSVNSPLNWLLFNVVLWASYYILGYLLVSSTKKRIGIGLLLFAIGSAWIIGIQAVLHIVPNTDYYNFFYGDIGVFLAGVGCFIILKWLFEGMDKNDKTCKEKGNFPRRLVSWISANCLGIFFVHLMICSAVRWMFERLGISAPTPILAILFTFVVVFISMVCVWVITKIKPLRWMLMK